MNPKYQSIGSVVDKGDVIDMSVVFSNYSLEGDKMTKNYKPYYTTNSLNKILNEKENGLDLLDQDQKKEID